MLLRSVQFYFICFEYYAYSQQINRYTTLPSAETHMSVITWSKMPSPGHKLSHVFLSVQDLFAAWSSVFPWNCWRMNLTMTCDSILVKFMETVNLSTLADMSGTFSAKSAKICVKTSWVTCSTQTCSLMQRACLVNGASLKFSDTSCFRFVLKHWIMNVTCERLN